MNKKQTIKDLIYRAIIDQFGNKILKVEYYDSKELNVYLSPFYSPYKMDFISSLIDFLKAKGPTNAKMTIYLLEDKRERKWNVI